MKFLSLCFIALFLFGTSQNASAKKFKVNVYVTDVNGVSHHVHGWIDVSFLPPKVNSYDMWFDGIHLVGSAPVDPAFSTSAYNNFIPDYPDWSTEMSWVELIDYLNVFSPYLLEYGEPVFGTESIQLNRTDSFNPVHL